jgi:Rho-binding antiterminator
MNTTEEYHPIDCDLHDYLEIACMYHYWLRIELTDGTCFDAKALTTCTTVEKEEFLVVGQSENQQNPSGLSVSYHRADARSDV